MNRQSMLAGLISAALTSIEHATAAEPVFDLQAFSSEGAAVDVSRFSRYDLMSPGTHLMEIIVNGQPMGRREVTFMTTDAQADAVPCVDHDLLLQLGVAPERIGTLRTASECPALADWLPAATSRVDAAALEWTVSLPQVYVRQLPRGFIDPSYWDEGINAGLLNYTFSTTRMMAGAGTDRAYLGLNAGLNLGRWRLRHQGAQTWDSATGQPPYQNTSTFAQRSLPVWQAQLRVGDSFSSGQILEGVRVRGVTLASDERMLAPSRQGYAPLVRGVAEGNATVTIRQNGYTLYETTVAPGPFEINDLPATGYGGDLTVSVTEVDGRRNTFTVPYSATPLLLRSGARHYQVSLGQVNQLGVSAGMPAMVQGTLAHGVADGLTVYGGGTGTQGYHQGKLGVAASTALGVWSLDATGSRTRLDGQGNRSGHSLGLGYYKSVPTSGTHFALGMYRYSTPGYFSLYDALSAQEGLRKGYGAERLARQKSRIDLNVSQQLGGGTLTLSGSSTAYWRRQQGRQTTFSVSYGATWKRLGWNVSMQRSRVEDTRLRDEQRRSPREHSDALFFGDVGQRGRLDNRITLTLSMPVGAGLRAPTLTSTQHWDRGDRRGSQQQLGLNGLLGEDASAHYGVWANRSAAAGSRASAVNAYTGYRGEAVAMRLGYGQSNQGAQLAFSADGALVAHSDGLILSQSLGESAALVHAPNAQGAALNNGHARIGAGGYAVAPNLQAFRRNVVTLDPNGMPVDVELLESSQSVVPTLGALTLLRFKVASGRAVIVKARRDNGKPLPFAAQVFDEQGREVGVVGQASKAFVRGISDSGRLTVRWSAAADGRCVIVYQLPSRPSAERQRSAQVWEGRCVAIP
ncbi:fimbria/pilus outer membrane usher protein [Pseudomonas sp. CYM-20-01]|uniref:fimbria/pilus outer membrane usher protein n=1 Tax=Pseudomonas sp. CYM-20-01 TaxID=2870750 RepID=UPI0020BD7122|nr:fimbria/pilus outer membrane usher protein [Pseudomonas sp. CYM-20-01]